MPNILFVCTANRYRSVIAAECFRSELVKHKQENTWMVSSAGTWAMDGMPPMSDATEKAKQMGLDIHLHRSKAITENMIQEADLVLVMESGQKEALQVEFPLFQSKTWLLTDAVKGTPYDIPDPVTGLTDGDVALEICELIREGFDKIRVLASG